MPASRFLIVESLFYEDIAKALREGASAALQKERTRWDSLNVPGALEIPAAIARAYDAHPEKYDGFIALGCVIRGETAHYDIVAGESARGLMELGVHYGLAVGNGILTCETRAQAMHRAHIDEGDKGGGAARAALALVSAEKRVSRGNS